jgi:hypothetical protein
MQPPSLLSSLSEITELQEPELPQPEVPQPVLLPLLRGADDDASDDARSSSSTRSLLRDPQPLSHRWPPALRGLPPPEPVPRQPMLSGPPRQRELPPGQPGSPH